MEIMLLLVGILLGTGVGTTVCIKYLKQEMTARVAPSLDLMRLQLDNVPSAVNLALANWHAELHVHERPEIPTAVARYEVSPARDTFDRPR